MTDDLKLSKLTNESEYILWKQKLMLFLTVKELDSVLDDDAISKKDFNKKDAKAKLLIICAISEKYMVYAINCKTTKDILDKFDLLFLGHEDTQISRLLEEYFKFKFENNDLMTDIAEIENKAMRLRNLGYKFDDKQIISKILSNLPEKLYHFRTAWESTSSADKNLINLISRLNLEIRMRQEYTDSFEEQKPTTSAKYDNIEHKENSFHVRSCFKCGKKGHIARFCRTMNGDGKANNNIAQCYKCMKSGHRHADCNIKFNCVNCKNDSHFTKFCLKQIVSNFYANNSAEAEVEFIIDSGTSSHIVTSDSYLKDTKKINYEIMTADGNIHHVNTMGNMYTKNIIFKDVLCVPQLKKNLISVSRLADDNYLLKFFRTSCHIESEGSECIEVGELKQDGLYYLNVKTKPVVCSRSVNIFQINADFWHRALGHVPINRTKDLVRGIDRGLVKEIDICEVCTQSKLCRKSFKTNRHRASEPLEIIHSDICGPIETETWDGYKYFITFLDDYTHFVKVFLIKNKNEAFSKIINYINLAENHFKTTVKTFRCDNGGEYTSKQFKMYCSNKGINIDYTIPYTPQLNGKAERLNRSLMERTRALLFDLQLPHVLWGEAVLTSAYLLNRSANTINVKTPAEMWFNRIPNLKHLNIFGSLAYYKNNFQLHKLDSRSSKGLLVGFTNNGYKIWDPSSFRIVYSRDVVFNNNKSDVADYLKMCNCRVKQFDLENLFKQVSVDIGGDGFRGEGGDDFRGEGGDDFCNDSGDRAVGDKVVFENRAEVSNEDAEVFEDSIEDVVVGVSGEDVEVRGVGVEDNEIFEDSVEDIGVGVEEDNNSLRGEVRDDTVVEISDEFEDAIEQVINDGLRILPNRERKLPSRLKDYDLETSFLTYTDVFNSFDKDLWKQAMNEEKDSLERNKTWEIVNKSEAKNRKIISSKWIFTIKPGGRYKARLVARGFLQKYNIDYKETYSPVVNTTSVRLLLAIAAQKGFKIKQFDVKTAFLYGELNEDIFMEIPLGYDIKDKENKVCKLKKSLYGLKQAPLMWNKRLTEFLKKMGFSQLKSDPCVFINKDKEIYLAIYVDDGILIGENEIDLNKIINKLETEFEMRKFDKTEKFIGFDVKVERNSIKIYQESYINQILEKFKYESLKDSSHPDILVDTHQEGKVGVDDVHRYRQLIGSLLYLVNKTRLDLAFHVGYCSRHQEHPNLNDFTNIKNLFRYIKNTVSSGIQYVRGNDLTLKAYCDADFAGDPDTRKSTTGFIIFYGGGPIHWCSRKQSVTALSSTEAEYISAAECIKDLLYIQSLIYELTNKLPKTQLFVDNQSAIVLIKNGILNRRSKHIDVKYHFIKEKVDKNLLEILYCSTKNNLADILTKPLDRTKFLRLRQCIVSDT